jgi:hypothetical protein
MAFESTPGFTGREWLFDLAPGSRGATVAKDVTSFRATFAEISGSAEATARLLLKALEQKT